LALIKGKIFPSKIPKEALYKAYISSGSIGLKNRANYCVERYSVDYFLKTF
jgi:hypothetical protein